MDEHVKHKRKIVGLIFTGIVLTLVTSFLYRIGFIPFVGKVIAENKIKAYAKVQLNKTEPIKMKYDWYNGIYVCSPHSGFALSYQLKNNTIFDGAANNQANADLIKVYKGITDKFPANITFPEGVYIWSTVNADDYDIKAQRLYLLEVYNTADLTETDSHKMPASIGADFIAFLGSDYNITGIQLIYADRNGMSDIEISADTFQSLEYEQLLKATKKRTEKEIPESYRKWMEKNGL